MALILCSECGTQVSDKASVCPKCGAPIVPVDIDNCKKFNIYWNERSGGLLNPKSVLYVNGAKVGEFLWKEDFSVDVPITSNQIEVEVKGHLKFKKTFEVDSSQDYSCEIQPEGLALLGEDGCVLEEDKLSFILRLISIFFWPIGLVIWYNKKDTEPIASRTALIYSLMGILFCFLFGLEIVILS